MPLPFRRITARIESWFRRHQRSLPWRAGYDPYHVWLSEVMLQQTRMEVVLRYYGPFLERFPDLHALATASDDAVLAAWSGLGYYRRARMLRQGAADVTARFEGKVPADCGDLTTLPGIGRYTAGAISSIAYDRRAPIVDGNVARILSRLFGVEAATGSQELMRASWALAGGLIANCDSPRHFNQGLMEIGALVCKPRAPQCGRCPVAGYCSAHASGRASDLPLRKKATSVRSLTIPLYVVNDRRGRVLMRRERGPLMDFLFHLPHGNCSLLSAKPLDVEAPKLLGSFRHTVTDRNIEFRVYSARTTRRARGPYAWIDPTRISEVPHASYVKKALALAK